MAISKGRHFKVNLPIMKKILINPIFIGLLVMAVVFTVTYLSGFNYINYTR